MNPTNALLYDSLFCDRRRRERVVGVPSSLTRGRRALDEQHLDGRLLSSRLRSSQLFGPSWVASGEALRPPEAGYTLGDPGQPAEVPTLLQAIFDNSASVIGPAGTDPLSNRFAEVAHAFAIVARNGARHELGAVLHFDTPSSGEIGPVPITRRGLRKLRAGLRVPPDVRGSSELAPSLRRATEIAQAHPDAQVTLVVLSDFLLLDREPGSVLSDLAAFPGTVHAVVLGSRIPTGVLDSGTTVTHIGRDDSPGAVARAIFASLIAHRRRDGVGEQDADVEQVTSRIPQHMSRHREPLAEPAR